MELTKIKVAIVHDWLITFTGAERVIEQMLICLPQSDLFSLVDFMPDDNRSFLMNKPVTTSFIQKLPKAKTKYRNYLPLMPFAVEQFDLSGYDLIISSSHAVAKGVIVGPNQLHICYCHSPMRYVWDLYHQYLSDSSMLVSMFFPFLAQRLRTWDRLSADRVDFFVANSRFISRRISKSYRRESNVIYPPVDVSKFPLQRKKNTFYLTASRLVPYKKIPAIIQAFSFMPDRKLVVIGDGPDYAKCRTLARSNVNLMGWQPFKVLKSHMQNAKAFIFAAEEDFGIVPLEAQACGTPVIAFGKGAVLETIKGLDSEQPTGVFFDQQTPKAIAEAVKLFEQEVTRISPDACRRNVLSYSPERFRHEFTSYVISLYQRHLTTLM